MNRPPLTERQYQLLNHIVRLTASNGFAPSFRDLMAEMGIRSANGIACHLRALVKKGYVRRAYGKARTLQVVKEQTTC